ncbi:uncharacterized protein BDW43DRAFT_310246 [Aspergillus alliaceus]|uniref:uncharacterized protein n=1 Tax=Petromyces alliaceus TaxID=209559 RepID=UPI0012A5F3EF|nr:uncharacterized protein BDW43DRAFT_310246 [Aspergillus alliaceus]KAB8234584.1 hypothetical protein BDW43DRAFT_310246 [Aspergillus alliaceus]
MAYFGPQFFSLLVGNNNSLTLLLTRIFGAPKVTSYLAFIIWIAERFLRRPLFIFGVLSMSLCMLSTSSVRQISPSPRRYQQQQPIPQIRTHSYPNYLADLPRHSRVQPLLVWMERRQNPV